MRLFPPDVPPRVYLFRDEMTLDHAFGSSLAFLINDAENERTSNTMNESSSFFHTLFLLLFHPPVRPSIFLPSSFFHQPLPPPVPPSCSTLHFPAIVILPSTSSSSSSTILFHPPFSCHRYSSINLFLLPFSSSTILFHPPFSCTILPWSKMERGTGWHPTYFFLHVHWTSPLIYSTLR